MEFQSHTAEFDYLKSLEIEEKINQIKWCQNSNNAHYLLSTNDKTIKLWKAHERNVREISHYDAGNGNTNGSGLKDGNSSINIPRYWNCNRILATKTKRVYANAHTYHINSIALNSDGETFMSADDLRVNLWSLGISNQSFSTLNHRMTYRLILISGCAQISLTLSRTIWKSSLKSSQRPISIRFIVIS